METFKIEVQEFLSRIVAVSYTHLDVYKRQVLGGVINTSEIDCAAV